MTRIALSLLAAALVSLAAPRAEALPTGWSTLAFGTFTLIDDTTNGLQWLSPTESTSISYDTMVGHLANPASAYYGLRHATIAEVTALFAAYGVTGSDLNGFLSSLQAPANTFFGDWGITDMPNPYSEAIRGLTGTSPGGSQQYMGQVVHDDSYDLALFDTLSSTSQPFSHPSFGSWLVVDASVPEPSVALLAGLGLAAFLGRRQLAISRRRRLPTFSA